MKIRHPLFGVLGRRLLWWMLLINGVSALVATSIQLYANYRQDVAELNEALDFIQSSQLPGLAQAAWNFDRPQLQAQIDGIHNSIWISGALLRYGPHGKEVVQRGHIDPASPNLWQKDLLHGQNEHVIQVGQLLLQPDVRQLWKKTLDRLVVVFITQTAKTTVISLGLLWLMFSMVTRHLTRMAKFASELRLGSDQAPLELARSPTHQHDELGQLQSGLNTAYTRLQASHQAELRHIQELEARVAQRTQALQEANARLAEQAHHDPLTGLANRVLLDERMRSALVRAQRHQTKLAVLLIDLDRFKPINDQFGHAAGDALLAELAHRMKGVLRATDTLARIGGDEFVVILEDLESDESVARVRTELKRVLRQPWSRQNIALEISGSIGVAYFPQDGSDSHDLLRVADGRMYADKEVAQRQAAWSAGETARH